MLLSLVFGEIARRLLFQVLQEGDRLQIGVQVRELQDAGDVRAFLVVTNCFRPAPVDDEALEVSNPAYLFATARPPPARRLQAHHPTFRTSSTQHNA